MTPRPDTDPLDRIEQRAYRQAAHSAETFGDGWIPSVIVAVPDVLALVAVARAARPLFTLAAVAHEGDPWYAEHEGLDAEKIITDAREALARLDGAS